MPFNRCSPCLARIGWRRHVPRSTGTLLLRGDSVTFRALDNMNARLAPLIQSGALAVAFCGVILLYGGEGGTPPTASARQTEAENPCEASRPAPAARVDATARNRSKLRDGLRDVHPQSTLLDALWRHRAAQRRLTTLGVSSRATEDVGDVAVIQDEGDLIAPANMFDLQETGLRYLPKVGGGYDIVRADSSFRTPLGDGVRLDDDDTVARNLAFDFSFFDTTHSVAFVNSDGNITFGEGDDASSPRDIARLLAGAPRVAPFLADLDPSVGGTVFVRSGTDVFTTTWCAVPVFGSSRRATLQVSLFVDGTIEMRYADASSWTAADGVVGITPGHTENFLPVDLITTGTATIAGNTGAIGEQFSERPSLDHVELARKFYRTHADTYDQLIVWTDTVLTRGEAFSFEFSVANDISGIGLGQFDFSSDFGSTGRRLRSVVHMDAVSKFPDDPMTTFLGENNTLSILGHEVGHRWLAFLQFTDHNHQRSDALLGRQQAHWSFFLNSDGSVMEGNGIRDLGGGAFRTVAAVERYSLLDQYVMGLVRDTDVPPFFYVENPTNVEPEAEAGAAPRVGATFTGTRRDVLIGDVIEAMGPRLPSADDSPKVHRQAFIFLATKGRPTDRPAVAKIDRIRRAWERFFTQATEGRSRVETRLRPSS